MRALRSICALAAMILLAGAGQAESGRTPSIGQIQREGITGQLSLKLGTIVIVDGRVVANASTSKADSDVPFLLEIEKVNGKKMAKPVRYRFRLANQWVKAKPPSIGEQFRYAGYESGAFVGSPDGEFKYVPAYTTTGYHFEASFLILASVR